MHVGTFTPAGTFEAAIEKLDHLRDLGITHVSSCRSMFRGNGIGGMMCDLFAPDHVYVVLEGTEAIGGACHRRN